MSKRSKLILGIGIGLGVFVIAFVIVFLVALPDQTNVSLTADQVRLSEQTQANYIEIEEPSEGITEAIEATKEKGVESFSKIQKIINDNVLGFSLSSDGRFLYYISDSRARLYKYNLVDEDKSTIISVNTSEDVVSEWSPSGEAVILKEGDSVRSINFELNQATDLPNNWRGFSFSEDGSRISFQEMGSFPGSSTIMTATPEGKNIKEIVRFTNYTESYAVTDRGIYSFFVPGTNLLGYYLDPLDLSAPVNSYVNYETLKKAKFPLESATKIQFSPNSKKMLYGIWDTDLNRPKIFVQNFDGTGKSYTGFENLPNKCAWMNDSVNIVCTKSQDIIGMVTNDVFFMYNTETKNEVQLTAYDANLYIDAHKVEVADDNSAFYFLNLAKDGGIYRVGIK